MGGVTMDFHETKTKTNHKENNQRLSSNTKHGSNNNDKMKYVHAKTVTWMNVNRCALIWMRKKRNEERKYLYCDQIRINLVLGKCMQTKKKNRLLIVGGD